MSKTNNISKTSNEKTFDKQLKALEKGKISYIIVAGKDSNNASLELTEEEKKVLEKGKVLCRCGHYSDYSWGGDCKECFMRKQNTYRERGIDEGMDVMND